MIVVAAEGLAGADHETLVARGDGDRRDARHRHRNIDHDRIAAGEPVDDRQRDGHVRVLAPPRERSLHERDVCREGLASSSCGRGSPRCPSRGGARRSGARRSDRRRGGPPTPRSRCGFAHRRDPARARTPRRSRCRICRSWWGPTPSTIEEREQRPLDDGAGHPAAVVLDGGTHRARRRCARAVRRCAWRRRRCRSAPARAETRTGPRTGGPCRRRCPPRR